MVQAVEMSVVSFGWRTTILHSLETMKSSVHGIFSTVEASIKPCGRRSLGN